MSEWIDIVVYATFIAAVWGWLPAWISRLRMPLIAERNREWAAGHPEIELRFARRDWFQRACLWWGAASILVLLAFQAGVWPQRLAFPRATLKWEALKDLNSALFIAGLIWVAGCITRFYRWVHANVPLSPRRQAALERRSVGDSVPAMLWYAVSALIALHLALWVLVGVIGRNSTPAFWGDVAFQFAISGVALWFVTSAVRRRPGTMDRLWGATDRRAVIRLGFVAQLLPLFNGAARLYEQISGTRPEYADRLSHLGLMLLLAFLATALAVASGKAGTGRIRWSHSATSTGMLALTALTAM